jgi:SH3-like domain-containing protein
MSFILSILGYYSSDKQTKKLTSHSTAIIMSPSVTVKSSPDKNGTDLFIIHEGLKVSIIGRSQGWKEIKLSDGKVGWLPDETIERI